MGNEVGNPNAETEPANAQPFELAYILKSVNADMTSYNGFVWPAEGPVEAPDWNAQPECGGGLHGWLWGQGDFSLAVPNARWLIASINKADCIDLSGKIKVARAWVIFCGDRFGATFELLRLREEHLLCASVQNEKEFVQGDSGAATVKGNYGAATVQGNYGAATVKGNYGAATVQGNYGAATVQGNCGAATVQGNCDAATVKGNCGAATVKGYCGAATVKGNYGAATVQGNYGAATVQGNYGAATVQGNYGAATVKGDYGAATVKGNGLSTVFGAHGQVSGGAGSALVLTWFLDGSSVRAVVAHVGEDGIKPDSWYRLNDDHEFVEVSADAQS